MTKKDWTQELNDRLAHYEAPVPDDLWADIEQSLPQAKRQPLWWRWASIAAVVALVMGAGWWLWPQGETPEMALQLPHTIHTTHQPQPAQPDAAPMPLLAQATAPVVRAIPAIADEPQPSSPSPEQETPSQEEAPSQASPLPQHPITSTRVEHEQQPTATVTIKKTRTVSIGLHGNSGVISTIGDSFTTNTGDQQVYNDYTNHNPNHDINDNTPEPTQEYRQHHDHPISLGLTATYPLTDRWSLQTGLVYTRLHADFETINKQTRISEEQTLHYLGIPLGAQYLLWADRRWKLYLSAGLQMDWNISAKSESKGTRLPMQRDQLQWSASGTLGIEYCPIPQLGIYAEPGLRYYFDNGSKVQNFFKDQPASWTFQFGVRLNLQK